ncbi:MAG: dehydrogenase [Desulfocapsa sp.]|nr:MAG: dehydrogenase [Desulfocapsa sp.]
MKLIINNLLIALEADCEKAYLSAASEKIDVPLDEISLVKLLSKALDIRNKKQFYYKISLVVSVSSSYKNQNTYEEFLLEDTSETVTSTGATARPLVIGFGPAGMFAALTLIDHGYRPIIFERGKRIGERSEDVERFIKEQKLNPESNIQFGEGGAGSYSDGKLFSRRNKNTSTVNRVLKTFVKFGAPREIEFISKPHLGTDVLCKIVKNIRTYILEHGGEIHYSSKMTDILLSNGSVSGIMVNDEEEYLSSSVFLALGHSARDTFSLLKQKGIALEQRKISVGVRIEHPVEIINRMRYGDKYCGFPGLGAATYSINHTNRKIKRGVYTFCMCPGGEIVNASSEPDMLVLNGMSYSDRALPYSNGALVVSCHCSDYNSEDPLAGIAFQQQIEKNAFIAGGSDWKAPAQNLMHFLGETKQNEVQRTSYRMAVTAADMHTIFPDFVINELHAAFNKWKADVPLFVSEHALLLAAETRTSSTVRISRTENFESVNTKNLYPIGEGAGYTGGITSSAADAIKAVEKFITLQ